MMNFITYFATVVAPTLSSILITIAYLPQVVKTQKTKSVEDLSLGFWILISAFLVCMVLNATYLLATAHAVGYFVTEMINFIFALTVLTQILVFRKRK
jgi:uncharacterized protein with PQ loop repeat